MGLCLFGDCVATTMQDPDFDLSSIGGASPSRSSAAAQPPPQPASGAQPSSAGQHDDSKPAAAVPPQEPEPAVPSGGAGPSSQAAPSSASRRVQVGADGQHVPAPGPIMLPCRATVTSSCMHASSREACMLSCSAALGRPRAFRMSSC